MAVSQLTAADQSVRDHTAALREYVGTDVFKHLTALLAGLKVVYMHDLVDVSDANLKSKQGALKQVMALERALTGERIDTPRV